MITDISSRAAVEAVIRHRAGAIVVSTMTAMRWMHKLSGSELDLSVMPLMGGASAVGLGISIAQPDRNVIVLDGDGSLLMQLATLATVAAAAPANYHHVVFGNGVWYEGGANIPLPGGRQDFVNLARASGYVSTDEVTTKSQLDSILPQFLAAPGPNLLSIVVEPADDQAWSADNPQPIRGDSQFEEMGRDIHRLRARFRNMKEA